MTQLSVCNLSVRKGEATLLDGVSFDAKGGELIGVVGPNGAGKSTLLRALAGVERQIAGSIMLDGVELATMTPRTRARTLSYLPQTREVHWAMTAEAVVSLGRFSYGAPHRLGAEDRDAVDRALAAADVSAFRARVVPTLSGGEQARVHLARALAAGTPVLYADEPTAALDLRHALSILSTLRDQAQSGALVIAAIHDLALARRCCTRLLVIDRGRIVADGASNVLTEGLIGEVFGVAARKSPDTFEFDLAVTQS